MRTSTDLRARTIGEAWIEAARSIMENGVAGTYDGVAMRELLMVTLRVERPSRFDAIIDEHADPVRLAWMHANFTDPARVAELGDADSYATRLRDYAHAGRDQLAWVVERLRDDPHCRGATVTTFQPLTDSRYVPCVSLLDFYLRAGSLELVVYAHSIDFGTKGFANLVELARLLEEVAERLAAPPGTLTLIVKSAHVYGADLERMGAVLEAAAGR